MANSLFEGIVANDPAPPSIAVFRLATLRSWDNRLDESVALYRRYIAQEPRDAEGRLALARTLAWGGHYASAIAIYDTLIAGNQRARDAVCRSRVVVVNRLPVFNVPWKKSCPAGPLFTIMMLLRGRSPKRGPRPSCQLPPCQLSQ